MSATICYQIVSTTVNCACITIEPINNIKQLFQEIGGVVKDIIIIYDTSNFGQLQNACHTTNMYSFPFVVTSLECGFSLLTTHT